MKSLRFFVIASIVVLIDQIVKVIVKLNMSLGQEITVLGDWFKIHFIENKGAAFGITLSSLFQWVLSWGNNQTSTHSEEADKLVLAVFSILAIFGIAWWMILAAKNTPQLATVIALILGGATGNLIDRIFYGRWFERINDYEGGLFNGNVVDMLYFDVWSGIMPDWIPFIGGRFYALLPVFNLADLAITSAILIIFIFYPKLIQPTTKISADNPIQTNNNQIPT